MLRVDKIIICSLLLFSKAAISQNAGKPPNIIIILADDMGYSDLGCYGSEISTPNLDRLASKGVKFTQFYNAARCCPTRAALMTGVYPHEAGMGEMVNTSGKINRDMESPYQGWLSKETVTIPEVLKTAGYNTYMAGKWHIGEERPDWPMQRGFDQYFGLISGANSYYELLPNRLILEGNEPYKIPDNFYMTDAITDKAIGYIDQNTTKDKNPFFMYVAYTAPHYPLHAPKDEIAKYRGKYRKGWDKLREERFERQLKLHLLPKDQKLSDREADIPAWENVEDKDEWDLKMATYAAMVTRMDEGVGKIVSKLEATGQLNNTMIIFLADNGGSSETWESRVRKDVGENKYPATLTTPTGEKGSYRTYGKPWASLSNTPFRLYKQYTHEGGIATPMIVYFPKLIKKPFQTDQVGHVIDLMPTCIELANATYPSAFKGRKIKPVQGVSLVPVIQGEKRNEHAILAWEHTDSRAIRQGNWKLVWSRLTKKWELYNMEKDRSETNDLSVKYPQKVNELIMLYDEWANHVGVKKSKTGQSE